MGKVFIVAKGAGKIVSIPISIIEEILSTRNNVDKVRQYSAGSLQYYKQIDNKLDSLQDYIDQNEHSMNQEEKDLVLRTMLYLFLERRGKLEAAIKTLDELHETFLKDRLKRILL